MKKILITAMLFTMVLGISSFKHSNDLNEDFNNYFENQTLRIDFNLNGNDTSEEFILKELKKQSIWAGSQKLATHTSVDMGSYRFLIYDSVSNLLLYKQGFCSLFNEWQTTAEAKSTKQSYYHVNLMPFPKNTVRYVLEKRAFSDGQFHPIQELFINPTNYFIVNEKPLPTKFTVIQGGDACNHKIDIAFVAEGYTKEEMKKFRKDVKRVWDYISSIPPFDEYRNEFNVYAVESISTESGTDIPGKHLYKNTVLNSMFYTFDTPRYLTTRDIKSLHDNAAVVPYDQLFVLINSAEYGGGGFYNYYSGSTVDHELSLKVALHEFGHGFAGLADEYYRSSVAYNGFYNLKTEPWEPNITTLVAFETKWKDMVPQGVNVPTERNKELKDSIGVYEGGGYSSKGIYSPFQDCRMKSNAPNNFCPVCKKSILQTIKNYIN
ncbi:MAG: M64 family metallopeptidase [Salinivirgaceae bacterium]